MPGLLGDSFDDPRTSGVMALAAGLLRGDPGGGLLGYTQASQSAKQQALQAQLSQMGIQKGSLELQQMQQAIERQNAIRSELAKMQGQGGAPQTAAAPTPPAQPTLNTPAIGGIPMFSQGTTMGASPPPQPPAQPAIAQTPGGGDGYGRALSQRLVSQADIYSRNGDFEGANKLYEQAAKFMPEVKEMGVLMQGNKPVNVITYKDGTQRVTDLAPTPKTHFADLGGGIQALNEYTGQPVGSPLRKTPTPDAVMTDSRERGQFKQTLAKDYMVAGFNPDGTPAGDLDITAKAIASGQLPPPSGMALTSPRNQRLLARVMELNPNYDATTVTAKKKAAADFTTGTLGNSMRSFAVAGQHLDQLGTLVDAMGNRDSQMVNKLGNLYSQQTGSPAVTNFDAAKDVVSKEVVKAIVAGGGGVAEREELSKLMSHANSPAQLKGVIAQYRSLMAAQHDALLQQRRAAGLPDSTLPNYSEANGSGAAATAATPNWRYQNGQLVKVN